MNTPKVRIKIHTDTMVDGKPVSAGEIVEVDPETAVRLAIRGDVLPPEAPGKTPPDQIEERDPDPENRDPKSRKGK